MFFFFKQKTAYDMRISDWSSDVCSSDLWGVVNIFHRAGERVERELDRNEQAQRQLQREQDGSEIRSVELERAIAEGITMIERRDTMEFFRECAAEQFRIHARKAWTDRTSTRLNSSH